MKSIFVQINSELILVMIARRTFEIMLAFAGLAGAMALRAFANFALQQLKMADTIGKMATKLQISTTALQTFRFAGEQSGETMETMDNNLI